MNSTVLGYVASTAPASSLSGGFGGGRGGVPSLPLGVGDVIQISIFESQAGGLFIPSDAGSRPGNYITLPNQTIDRDGTISVPYAGKIRAAGRSIEQVQDDIEQRLANRAIEPQAVITKISSRSAQVAVLGDVNSPAKIQLTEAGDRILDVISEAGGLSAPAVETYVTLQRRGHTARVHYTYLTKTPSENIYVYPGDTVLVDRERRTFTAFGASGLNGRIDFEETSLSLADALGKAGGLLDSRADPAQVYLYRIVDRSLLKQLGADSPKFGSETSVPVIFRANLRDPSTFFAAQKFPMQDRDIIYVTNSQATELYKFLDLVGSVPATAGNVSGDSLATRNNIRAF
ncbi:polysaccharide export protein [Rhizobiaceae bacterium BDR2-2]|uniref:Polysaccharide export protein n=1 Tax=Ectorhizobium quercum TaxID=2965071 RepID=A0AAE3N1G1_9HYPH|nr:polysaccharide export protein [Ectorhizobium quercum]